MNKTVLGFMAHPDDVEFTCAGTMIRLQKEAGFKAAIATATSGECGTTQYRPDEIARIRHGEAKAAAALIDADYYCAGCDDLFVIYNAATLQRFVEIVRQARPGLVITHPPMDYMIDHEETSRLVRTACFAAPAPNFLTYAIDPAPPLESIPYLYYTDPNENKDIFGEQMPRDFIVDISSVHEIKERMLACHASQREWLRAHHGIDEYLEIMRRTDRARGQLIGRPAGEGFRQHRGHAYPQDNVLTELLKNTS